MNAKTNGHNGNGAGNHKGERRRYSDKERGGILAALAANRGNVLKTSRDTGIPRKTIELWSKDQIAGNLLPDVATECQLKKRDLADMCEELARKLCGVMLEDERIEKARYSELNSGFGTATDKMRLLREQSTSIQGATTSEVLDKALQTLNDQRKALEAKHGVPIAPYTREEIERAADFPLASEAKQ